MATTKGFIKDHSGNHLLPITRAELVLDSSGNIALASSLFLAGTHTDAQGNKLPGLITAAERAMLSGSGTGQNLSDLYTKIGYINSGIKVGNTTLPFYTETTTGDTTTFAQNTISITGTNNITVTPSSVGNNSTITVDLAKIYNTGVTGSAEGPTSTGEGVITTVTTDNYGRVTAYSKTNNLTGCTVDNLDENSSANAIANKAYVDAVNSKLTSLATGALIFKGSVTNTTDAEAKLTEEFLNCYFKVTGSFTLAKESTDQDTQITVKPGDTLIVTGEELEENGQKTTTYKFVYIPSADDVEYTYIDVYQGETNKLDNGVGEVSFNFSDQFVVNGTKADARSTVSVGLQIAGKTETINENGETTTTYNGGVLTKDDYQKFLSYSAKSISYSQTLTSGYEIGKFTLDGNEVSVLGYVPELTVTYGTTADSINYNPTFKLSKPDGTSDLSVSFVGGNGISITESNKAVTFATSISIKEGSGAYLETSGYDVGVKLYKSEQNESGITTITDGLVSYSQVAALISANTHSFEIISTSLNTTQATDDGKTYFYGSSKLRTAIDIAI